MSVAVHYVLDANVFIEASRRYYAFEIALAFWRELKTLAGQGRLCSVDRVREELMRNKDALARWVKSEFGQAFHSTKNSATVTQYQQVIAWVEDQPQYTDSAKKDFASGADGRVVAYAPAMSSTVVTQEKCNRDIRKRVPIPNVCAALGVPFLDTFAMLRALNVKFP